MLSSLGLPYLALLAAVACERLAEVLLSRAHERLLADRGGIELGASHYPWMVALHGGFLVACVAEPWLLHRPFHGWVFRLATIAVALTMAVRTWCMRALGDRWTTRVIVVPGEAPVRSGPYRWLRHPNYAAVVVELAAIPLAHSAWLTAIVFGAFNAAVLRLRVRSEEALFTELPDYPARLRGCSRS